MAASSAPPRPLREEAWHFERQGFEPRIAQTLVAYEHGLRPVPSGWRLDELARLLFLQRTAERWR